MIKKLYALAIAVFMALPSISFAQSNISTRDKLKSVIRTSMVDELGFAEGDADAIRVMDWHFDESNQMYYVYVRQHHYGPVFNTTSAFAVRNDSVLHYSGGLVQNLEKYLIPELTQDFTPTEAFQSLLDHLEIERNDFTVDLTNDGALYVIRDSNWSPLTIEIVPGIVFTGEELRLVYGIEWYTADQQHLYYAKVDLVNREVLSVKDLVISCDFGHPERMNADPSVQHTDEVHKTQAEAGYQVFPWPVESPNHGNRKMVEDPWDTDASPYGWHDINGVNGAEYTITQGNNVWAKDDRDANNQGGYSPDGGSDLQFTAPFSNDSSARKYLDAAIINLFYWNNLMHDVWYHYGFNEGAGNFQENNYSKGGVGSDYVNADAQDGSGTNNANFAPLSEGENPRMQMYLWSQNTDFFQVDTPNHLRSKYTAVHSTVGPRLSPEPIRAKLVVADDGSDQGSRGCSEFVNASEVNGNIALIDRGGCTYTQKINNAQNAGAVAIVMINNRAGDPATIRGNGTGVNIPQVMITQDEGTLLKNEIGKGFEVIGALYDSTYYYDSDFDNGVIAHEYTHGISTRLTGGPSDSECLTNVEQMGEGWSDFLSLVMTHEPDDEGSDKRGIGTYVRNQPTDGGGIRPYPYSTDLSINPVTYDDIKLTQFTVPHGVGSVWCSMLWDLYWAFIDEYGYDPDIYNGTGGNNMVMHLVMDGLKLQPCSPGFVDGRDAILKADELRNAGANTKLIWEVFARRGLGYSADQGSSNSKSDGSESFDLPPVFGHFTVTKTGAHGVNAGDTINYTIKVVNTGGEELETVYVKDSLGKEGRYVQGSSQCDIQLHPDSNTFVFIVKNVMPGDSFECSYQVVSDSSTGGKLLVLDDAETDTFAWTLVLDQGSGIWERSTLESKSGEFSWFVNNAATQTDRWMQADFDLTGASKPTLVFSHLYDTEDGWDGGVVEILVNETWVDLGDLMVSGGYNKSIANNPQSRISNREAFTGKVDDFITTEIDLSIYAGNVVTIRFRFVTDGAQGGRGWFVDDVKLWNQYTALKNHAYVATNGLTPIIASTVTDVSRTELKDTVVVIIIDVNEELYVYPNPVLNDAVVHFESKVDRSLKLRLHDIAGRSLWEGEVLAKEEETVPMQHLAAGTYLLEIQDGEKLKVVKLLKD